MKKLTKEEMAGVMNKVRDGVLALSDGSTPYCIPFGFVYINDVVYLSMFPTGRKWEYFQKNPKVCFNVFCWTDDMTEWSSVVVDGTMEQVNDMETIEAVIRANMKKLGIDGEEYIQKRLGMYKKTMDSPKALKIFTIRAHDMQGRSMPMLIKEAKQS